MALSAETGFLKKRMLEMTTATRFMVLPTLKVTGAIPSPRTIYEACNRQLSTKRRRLTDLIVKMIEQSTDGQIREDLGRSHCLYGSCVARSPLSTFDDDRQWEAVDEGHERDETKEIDSVHVLQKCDRRGDMCESDFVFIEGLLGVDSSKDHTHVGDHGTVESTP